MDKWTSGQSTEGKVLALNLPMNLVKEQSKKTGKEYLGLARIGSNFGGVAIGVDDKGRHVMAKVAIYLKEPTGTSSANTSFSIG